MYFEALGPSEGKFGGALFFAKFFHDLRAYSEIFRIWKQNIGEMRKIFSRFS